ncbi:uncharacterized protein K444DRAFT_714258 [Hyaloscypha bicolor E]|uniref:Uncharacterized protein n=1 Tax=Hyaloscypha bicolor E TaxID=1095630 RepID=A0A2J6TMQ3_9HELO|nr:uncharacterized protein K444DRAFT_714258 [Hyaloscypha bicolor E]PMD64301.1 hypothetical protein K444DRAFT_714258 [Hyaloscypha bicolor E]
MDNFNHDLTLEQRAKIKARREKKKEEKEESKAKKKEEEKWMAENPGMVRKRSKMRENLAPLYKRVVKRREEVEGKEAVGGSLDGDWLERGRELKEERARVSAFGQDI